MGESILKEKSFDFALEIVHTYKQLRENGEFVMSKQLLRSGETLYWLELLSRAEFLNTSQANSFINSCKELISMLVATTKKTAPRQQ